MPLNKLLKRDLKFEWSEQCKKAFQEMITYLSSTPFVMYTDHTPLTYLNSTTLSLARLTRWRLKLAENDFEIIYKKGILNSNADALKSDVKNQTGRVSGGHE